MKSAPPLEKMVEALVTESDVVMYESMQKKLIQETTESNYQEVIAMMQDHAMTSQLDLSMYIREISEKNYDGLKVIILSLLEDFTDQDAIDDLEQALKQFKKS